MVVKDRGLKAMVLRYVTAKRWLPQLEVIVLPPMATTRRTVPITDIDVLAEVPDEFVGFRRVIIDCKTRKSESPIARTLWLAGLMRHLSVSRGIIVLQRPKVEADHRHFAAQHDILLLTADDFTQYAAATLDNSELSISNAGRLECWEHFISIPERFPGLKKGVELSRHAYWTAQSAGHACRRVVVAISRIAKELDPKQPLHVALFGDLACLFMHAIARITALVFPAFLQPDTKDDMANALLLVLFGGREAYEYRSALQKQVAPGLNGDIAAGLAFPKWDVLVQFVRQCLDAPAHAAAAPLILREVAWSVLASDLSKTPIDLTYARVLAGSSRHSAKLALLGAEYLAKAGGVPPEFSEIYSQHLLDIQGGATAG